MPPQQGDNEEEQAGAGPGPGPRAGSSGGEEVAVRRVAHAHKQKRKGSGDEEGGDGIGEERPVVLLDGKAEAEAAAEAEEEELRATREMVHYCFEVLLHHFRGGTPPVPAFNTAVECPLFVTWEKEQPSSRSSSASLSHHLRGCIGTLSPRPLEALGDYVHSSAFRDRRFPPIAEHEVPTLRCSVSLLVQYEDAAHAFDWEVGVHGIIIAFKCPTGSGRRYSATYLPEVAREQRWTKEEALKSLVRKAGYNGKLTEAFWGRVAVTRYQSSKATVSYADFLLANASAGSQPGTAAGGGTRSSTGTGGGKRIQIS